MNSLSKLNYEACDAGSVSLTKREAESLMPEVAGWELVDDSGIYKLRRKFATVSYAKSMAFTNAVAELATSVNHHPQMIVEYSSVTVIWWSHDIKGLHKNDFIMAAKTSELF